MTTFWNRIRDHARTFLAGQGSPATAQPPHPLEARWQQLMAAALPPSSPPPNVPDPGPDPWPELLAMDQTHFPGRLEATLLEFLATRPPTRTQRHRLSTLLSPERPPGPALLRHLVEMTSPGHTADPELRAWALELVLRHLADVPDPASVLTRTITGENSPRIFQVLATHLPPELPADTARRLQPAVRERLRAMETHGRLETPDPDRQNENLTTHRLLWQLRQQLDHLAPEPGLLPDLRRTLALHPGGEPLTFLLSIAPTARHPETATTWEQTVLDGLVARLYGAADPESQLATRHLLARLSHQTTPGKTGRLLLEGLAAGRYPLSSPVAAVLTDILATPASQRPVHPPLPPQEHFALSRRTWHLVTDFLLTHPEQAGPAHRELLLTLHAPAAGRSLPDVIRWGLTWPDPSPTRQEHLVELIAALPNAMDRIELWELAATTLPDTAESRERLTRLTTTLPEPTLVNHLVARAPELPAVAAEAALQHLLPQAVHLEDWQETPTRIALRHLWTCLPPETATRLLEQHARLVPLLGPVRTVAPGQPPPSPSAPPAAPSDPYPFLLASQVTPVPTHTHLGDVWERFLFIAARKIAEMEHDLSQATAWADMLRLTQAAVPPLELCTRLGQPALHQLIAASPELRTAVMEDLRTRLRQDATAAEHPRLSSILERLETMSRSKSPTGSSLAPDPSRPAASHQHSRQPGNSPR